MARVLISGNAPQMAAVAGELRDRGATVTEVDDLALMPAACSAAGPASFDAYVQLPATFTVRGDTAIRRVHHFFADGVLARFPALAAALPALTARARVTFVLGQLPAELDTPDDRQARQALVRVLEHAARADAGGELAVGVLESSATPTGIALEALGTGPAREEPGRRRLSELSYEEWRVELMSLTSVET